MAPTGKFRQSAYLQQTALFLGQEQVFSQASGLLKSLSGIELSAKQIENLCHHYGERLEEKALAGQTGNQEFDLEKDTRLHYAMVDGSYLMSREEGWIETKCGSQAEPGGPPGRIFKAGDCLGVPEKRTNSTSTYVAHIGAHGEFCDKLSPHLDKLSRVVFIADGAPWIWKWVQARYGEGVQILDFFHAYEKLCQWAVLVYKDKLMRRQWLQAMKGLLLEDRVEQVLLHIQDTDCLGDSLEKKKALLSYFENNKDRMRYKTYREAGYLIGSGAIESANRAVVQQRLKRSGQRWTLKGGQQVLNLRTANLSKQWEDVVSMVRMAA